MTLGWKFDKVFYQICFELTKASQITLVTIKFTYLCKNKCCFISNLILQNLLYKHFYCKSRANVLRSTSLDRKWKSYSGRSEAEVGGGGAGYAHHNTTCLSGPPYVRPLKLKKIEFSSNPKKNPFLNPKWKYSCLLFGSWNLKLILLCPSLIMIE